jgi:hypothetical protein
MNLGITSGDSAPATLSNLHIYGNDISNAANWDDSVNNTFHHNGIFLFIEASTTTMPGVQIYNNYIHGDMGARETGHIFLDGDGNGAAGSWTGALVFNNLLSETGTNHPSNGLFIAYLNGPSGNAPTTSVYNNVFAFSSNTGGRCFMLDAANKVNLKNNVFVNCGVALYLPDQAATLLTSDHNSFYGNTGVASDIHLSGLALTLAQWQTLSAAAYRTGLDLNSVATDPHLSAGYAPQTGSPLIGAGANLSSLGVTALNSDKAGVPRLTVWDIGACQTNPPSAPQPPSGLSVTVH